MANLRSFTGFLALDVLGTQNVAPGLSFAFPPSNQLDVLIQDGDTLLEGDTVTDEQSADPQGDQIGFITNSSGDALLDGQEIYLESSFTFSIDGAGSFTGYVIENEGSGQSFLVFPPSLPAGQILINTVDDNAASVAYDQLGSGDEDINQNDFSDLDLSGADTINGGGGDDTIDAGDGDDSVAAGNGADTVFGNAGGDTVDGGAGNDSIRGDSGEDGVTAVRESFNWGQLGLTNGQTVPNNVNGIDQDTGNITVNLDYTELGRFSDFEFRNDFNQNTSGIDTGGETIGNNVGFLLGDSTSPAGDTVSVDFNFSANAAGFEDEVRNVQFRINDLDDANWRDIIEITALDADGNPVHVVLTGGSNITLTDTDGVNGFDTATANNTNVNNQPIDASNSLLVEIPGPVASINIVYGNLETNGQRVDITDIFFDAVPTAIANVGTGDDSLLGGAGDDTIFGEAGEDTIDGGTDNDSIEGGANDDLLVINDNFGDDTITGGEIGETTGDTLDGGALTQAVDVQYTGDEAATFTNNAGSDGQFSQIEHINTGAGDDTIDGTLDTVGIDLNAGAGADTIQGGQAGDTLNAGSGADTIDGQAGDDTINAGDDADEIRLTDGFDNDSIIGGEGGVDVDIVSGATLTENIVVTYDGDESGNFVGQASGDNAAFDEIEGVTTGSGDDTVDASADNTGQIITTNAGVDSILGGSGGDTIDAGDNNDNVDGGAGADSILGGGGSDSILGGAGADTINAGTGGDTIDGGEGADSIDASNGFDLINLTGNFGNDTIVGGELGNDGDTLDGSTLTEAIDVTFSGDEAGNFTGQTTGSDATFSEIEAINTGSGDDTVDASADSVGTTINTGAGADTVLGGAGGDTLTTGTGDDTVDGGAGADSINAGDGDDELRLNDGFGNDTLIAGEGGETTGDTLAGGGLTENVAVTFANDEDGAVSNLGGDSASFVEVERVETGSGADTIDATASTGGVDVDSGAGADTITGGSGADTLAAAGGADTINGGAGNDSITAGDGDDVVQLTPGYDNDTIVGGEGGETNGDTLDGSTLAENVIVTYDGDEQGNFVGQTTGDNADFSEIEAINTGSGDDTIDASADNAGINVQTNAGADSVTGGGGDDQISTGTGADTVDGGAGADTIAAGDGDDLINLTGNFGNDSITGGEGAETPGGAGGDTLDGSTLAENVNVTFNGDEAGNFAGATTGSNATFAEIEAIETGSGDDAVDASADTQGVNISTNGGDDTVLGGTGGDTLAAGEGADTVDGGQGADSVTGGGGDDELRINNQFGDDTIVGGETNETNGDTLAGGGLTENVTVTFNNDGESGTVTNPGGDTATFSEIEAVETGSGDDTIDASGSPVGVNADSGAGADTITGGSGDDTFAAGAGDDTIEAGAGADSLAGGDGDDDFILTDNFDNDTIVGGEGGETNGDEINASTVTEPLNVTFNGDEAGTITGDNTADTATFSEIEEITTGTGDDTVDASADTVGVTINTGAGDDTVLGGQGGDTLNTGAGQDTVNGGAGADSIDAGDDQDTIQLTNGFGNDTIAGGEGGVDADTLAGGALTEAVTVTFNADDESGTVTNPGGDSATFSEIEAVETGSGNDTIDGSASTGGVNVDAGAGDDTITGGTGDDTFAGGEGADTIAGGRGDDVLDGEGGDDVFELVDEFGSDTITGGETNETNGDSIDGSALVQDTFVEFNADGESGRYVNEAGDNLQFSEIEAVSTGSGDDTIDASGSNVGVNADAGAGDDTVTGGDGADTLSAGAGLDIIDGGAGVDSIDGGADADSILGGAGADTIIGGDGADTIDGGEDNDFLTGGDEDDLFIYMAGQGDDTISDFNFGNTGALGDGDPTNNDFIDLTAFYTNLTEARADIADDGILNQSVGDFTDNTLLDGSITLAGVNAGGLTTDNTGLANEAGNFPHIVQGADGGAGVNQDGDNVFDDGRFYVEFIDNTGPTANLADLGFDTLDGSLGTAVPYNAGTTDDIDITNQTGTFGNDGTEFGARITTTLDVATGGAYTFTTTSDDGSILYINGTQVVNNDGLHSSQTASGTINLDPGQYEITVLYFENGGVENLSATIQGPDTGGAQLSLNDPTVNVRANAGAETVSGGAGDDTFLGGAGDDVLFGQGDQDTFLMTNGFDSDTITGGEGGTDLDTIDSSALSNGVNVVYSGDEAGAISDPFDTAIFSEIEVQILTGQNDTLDASNDTVGVRVLAGAGDDTLLGGSGGDTILGDAGQDTIAGEAGADLIAGDADQDLIILNDQFGDDTIVGGEGGVDSDTLDGSALTENVNVLFDGDEQGNITNPGGDNADFSEIEAIRTGSGQDTIDASADSAGTDIDSGAGNDTITGGAGQDTIVAGAGDDTINGGAGTDSIDAGADNDVIDGGDNTDTIFGGGGNDSITDTGGPLSDDTIFGGAGDDTIDGGVREDAIVAGDGDDLINLTGVFGDDTIVGGEGGETNGDTVSGSTLTENVVVTFSGDEAGDFVSQAGNGSANFVEIEAVETGLGADTVDATLDTTGVTIITNEGDDVIIGGAGDDSIDAGANDDTITFGQNDTVRGGAGADEFIIQATTGAMTVIADFDPSTNVDNTVIYDPLNPPNQDDNDFVDLSGFFANINELRAANTPNGDGDVVLDLGDGQTLTLIGVSDVTLLNFENTNVICFTRGALIRTPSGDVAVEDLREGDLVETMDNGAQPIRWIGRRSVSAGMIEATPRLRPVKIAKGALGNDRDLIVSPQHRMLLTGERAEMLFGVDEVLASAKDLVNGDTIYGGPTDDVEYFHILFDDHEIIFAEGAATESFHPGRQALSTTTQRAQAEILELFPELAETGEDRPAARMVLKSHEARAYLR